MTIVSGTSRGGPAVAQLALFALLGLGGCASHSEHMLPVRTALDEGQPREALHLLDDEMGVKSEHDLPADLGSDNALYILDRGSIQQSVTQFDAAKRDIFNIHEFNAFGVQNGFYDAPQ